MKAPITPRAASGWMISYGNSARAHAALAIGPTSVRMNSRILSTAACSCGVSRAWKPKKSASRNGAGTCCSAGIASVKVIGPLLHAEVTRQYVTRQYGAAWAVDDFRLVVDPVLCTGSASGQQPPFQLGWQPVTRPVGALRRDPTLLQPAPGVGHG